MTWCNPEAESMWWWFTLACWNCGAVPTALPAHYLCDKCRREQEK